GPGSHAGRDGCGCPGLDLSGIRFSSCGGTCGRSRCTTTGSAASCRGGQRPTPRSGRLVSVNVLVAEDHPLVATGLEFALGARGWQVATTSGPTVEAIVALATEQRPDCVLLDLHLGEQIGNGVALIEPLRATGARVVMLTAETDRFL